MNVYYSMKKEDVRTLLARSDEIESEEVSSAVREILEQVRTGGEEAVKERTLAFDGVELTSLLYDRERIGKEARQVSADLASAIAEAARNIETFHASQRPVHEKVEVQPGVTCWQKSVPLERVGLYIPGGTAPLFSTLLMLAVPAKLAGCPSITIATPPRPRRICRSDDPLLCRPARHQGYSHLRWSPGDRRPRLWNRVKQAGRQDLRSGKPLRHRGETAGELSRGVNRYAGRPERGHGCRRLLHSCPVCCC